MATGHERAARWVDRVDYHWMCGAAGGDRGHSLVPAHAHAGGRAWPAGLGGSTDTAIGGRHDRGSVHCPAGAADPTTAGGREAVPHLRHRSSGSDSGHSRSRQAVAGRDLQQQAWRWALTHRTSDGSLPSGLEIARQHGRHERWGRLVKRAGAAGGFATEPSLRLIDQRLSSAQSE